MMLFGYIYVVLFGSLLNPTSHDAIIKILLLQDEELAIVFGEQSKELDDYIILKVSVLLI
jgi:hypothetical protein